MSRTSNTDFRFNQEDIDYAIALSLQDSVPNESSKHPLRETRNQESSNHELALSLQKEEEVFMRSSVTPDLNPMNQDCRNMDMAWKLVELIVDTHVQLSKSNIGSTLIEIIGIDDMVFIAHKFLECREFYAASGISTDASLGFHYTKESNVQKIREEGLLSGSERSNPRSLAFGDGIYISNNATVFSKYGDVGLLVAMLKGNCSTANKMHQSRASYHNQFNTIIGNKTKPSKLGDDVNDEIVLQQSCQCLPLVRFQKSLLYPSDGSSSKLSKAGFTTLVVYFNEIQRCIDSMLNVPKKKRHRVFQSNIPWPNASSIKNVSSTYILPEPTKGLLSSLAHESTLIPQRIPWLQTPVPSPTLVTPLPMKQDASQLENMTFTYRAPDSFKTLCNDDLFKSIKVRRSNQIEECAICLEVMKPNQDIVSLNIQGCNHAFHRQCIKDSLQITQKCPICRQCTSEPQGTSPSGTLNISTTTSLCVSFEQTSRRSFVLKYSMQEGIQQSYHQNPGRHYSGTERVAYLPDTTHGRKLLHRLVYAFTKGLNFTVGTSLSTGKQSAITWSSIHHKTSLNGGVKHYGWPDDGYFINCNEELDALGVPANPPDLSTSSSKKAVTIASESSVHQNLSSFVIPLPPKEIKTKEILKNKDFSATHTSKLKKGLLKREQSLRLNVPSLRQRKKLLPALIEVQNDKPIPSVVQVLKDEPNVGIRSRNNPSEMNPNSMSSTTTASTSTGRMLSSQLVLLICMIVAMMWTYAIKILIQCVLLMACRCHNLKKE